LKCPQRPTVSCSTRILSILLICEAISSIRATTRRCSASGGSGISHARNLSSFKRTRLVVPSLARRQSSMKSAVRQSQPRNRGSSRSVFKSNSGKSFVTKAPSSDLGTSPIAPFRASIREVMNCPALATKRRPNNDMHDGASNKAMRGFTGIWRITLNGACEHTIC